VEPRAFFARDLAGIQLAVTDSEATAQAAGGEANIETRLYSNFGELIGMLPQLKIVAGPKTGSVLQLRYPSTSFGRSAGNDYRFPDDSLMSRNQAVIECEGASFILRDLNSTNGTLVNGQPVSEIQLRPGDVIEMGEMKIEFLAGGSK
jgi:pSer/pThr/pTyr-binding forkhead associated (FHA) protein